uniref:helix-turn-helix domain-containing protein n=1 Tax=Membranihabitans marinus TaxID=1227546 RepID=UPI00374D13B7
MAGKPTSMSKIKQLLQLYKKGESKRSIAQKLGISRNTVRTYLEKISHIQMDVDDLMALENPELEK